MSAFLSNRSDLWAGLAEAAAELGTSFSLYRPGLLQPVAGVYGDPLEQAAFLGAVLASFPRNYAYRLAIDPTKPQRVAVLDPAAVQPGDYLYDGTAAYFIGNMDPLTPIAAVQCNSRLSLRRQSATAPGRVGDVGRLGNVSTGTNASERVVLAGWPASLLYSGRGERTSAGLPTSSTAPQWTALLPALPVVPAPGDIVADDQNRRFAVVAAERNPGGFRVIANQAEY